MDQQDQTRPSNDLLAIEILGGLLDTGTYGSLMSSFLHAKSIMTKHRMSWQYDGSSFQYVLTPPGGKQPNWIILVDICTRDTSVQKIPFGNRKAFEDANEEERGAAIAVLMLLDRKTDSKNGLGSQIL